MAGPRQRPVPPPSYGAGVSPERVSSREAVLDAALRIVDTKGLDALTMRRVAAELDIPVTTLYGFIRTKAEILDALGPLALRDVQAGRDTPGPWAECLAHQVRGLRAALAAHPGVVELILTHSASSASFDHVREAILETLHRAGFTDRDALDAMGALVNYALGFAVAEGRRARFPQQTAAEPARLRRLHPHDFPRLTHVADAYLDHLSDAAFEAGLQHLMTGFQARLAGQQPIPG